MPTFGERLRQLRRERKLKQIEIAEMLKVTERTVRYYESDEREPDMAGLQTLADFFDVSLDYLMGRTDDPTPPTREPANGVPPEELAFLTWVKDHVTGMHFYDMHKSDQDQEWLKGLRIIYEKEKGRKPGQKQGE